MSSYLTIYLVPKKTTSKYNYQTEQVEDTEITKGIPLVYNSYSRNSDVYQAFWENLHPAYCGDVEKYTELTYEKAKYVISEFENDIKKTEQRLETDYKMLKEGGSFDELWEDIHSMEEYLREQKDTLNELNFIADFVYNITNGYTDFEKVLINID